MFVEEIFFSFPLSFLRVQASTFENREFHTIIFEIQKDTFLVLQSTYSIEVPNRQCVE